MREWEEKTSQKERKEEREMNNGEMEPRGKTEGGRERVRRVEA